MAIPLSTIYAELRRWIENASGLASNRVVFAHENAPQGSGAYIQVWGPLTNTPISATDETGEADDDGDVLTKQYRHCVFFVQGFGPGILLTLSNCRDALYREAVNDYFTAADLAITPEAIIDQTTLKGRNYEERGRFEVKILCGSEATDDVGYFTHVEYSSEDFNIPETTIPTS